MARRRLPALPGAQLDFFGLFPADASSLPLCAWCGVEPVQRRCRFCSRECAGRARIVGQLEVPCCWGKCENIAQLSPPRRHKGVHGALCDDHTILLREFLDRDLHITINRARFLAGAPMPVRFLINNPFVRAVLSVMRGKDCSACHATAQIEVDHINAIKDGGLTAIHNLQLLCQSCHRLKSASERTSRPRTVPRRLGRPNSQTDSLRGGVL